MAPNPRRLVTGGRSCTGSFGNFHTSRERHRAAWNGDCGRNVLACARRCGDGADITGADIASAELADANGAVHHSARSRRRRRRFCPPPGRRAAAEIRPAIRGREPSRRRAQHRRARLRRSAARRLHALRHVERTRGLQPVPVPHPSVQSREGFRADCQSVLQPGSAGGEYAAQGQNHSRPDCACEGQTRHA